MYLKRIELQGFKSFAGKTVLELMPGITAVVGPNGSGKSNISDAIKWVLGEQSMKSLRGSKLEDVIFSGTEARKSVGFAEVSLIIDNTDGSLPIEFSEVVVTRRAYRSGESNFYINKTPCRLKDILELFMDTGLGRDGYSIIGQGKIDEILSNKSEERRHIFEEAAGIVKYRTRKHEAEKKLEATEQNLVRINDIIIEIEGKLDTLKKQSDKAKKYLELKEELKSIEVGLFLDNIDKNKEKLNKVKEDEKILKAQEKEEENKLVELQANKEELKKDLDNLLEKIETIQNEVFDNKNFIERLHSEINISDTQILNNIKNLDRIKEEIDELNEKIVSLQDEKQSKDDKKTRLLNNKEKFVQELKEKEEELKKVSFTLTAQEERIEAVKVKIENCKDEKANKVTDINSSKAKIEMAVKREKQITEEKMSVISELDNTRIEKQAVEKVFYEINKERDEILQKLEKGNTIKKENSQKIKDFVDDINKKESDLRLKETRYKFLTETQKEKEGYYKSVKAILKSCEDGSISSAGVCGTVADLIEVPKDYELAIEMSLGSMLQNIVTDTEQDSKRLINFLKEKNLGRASFLPITAVKGKKIDKIKSSSLIIGIASDLINYDNKYEQVILNLLGKTVIVKDMDTAIKVAKDNSYSFKIVTLLGDIINPSGQMTGGSAPSKNNSILGRNRIIDELKADIDVLKKEIDSKQNELEDYKNSVEDILNETKQLEFKYQEIEITFATNKQKLSGLDENILKLENKLQFLKTEITEMQNHKTELEEAIVKYQEEELKLEEDITTMQKEVDDFNVKNKDKQTYIDNLNLDITNLKISVSSFDESGISLEEMITRIQQDIDNTKAEIEKKNVQIEKINLENEELKNKKEESKKQIENNEQNLKQKDEEIINLKEEKNQKNKKLDIYENDIITQFKTIETLKDGITKIDVKKEKIETEIEQVIEKMWEEYELTPNNAEGFKKPQNVAQTVKEVAKLRNDIKNLGSINVDSIEEYKEIKERYDFMSEQKIDLESAQKKLKSIISDMINIMKIQFTQQFKAINENFQKTFLDLFGGGKAKLRLTDESNVLESGIEIEVQPPGKKLQNMMLLSGGEKAFTAIALLFAILNLNPAPFCVLDEIEAALDDVNVYRYAEHLKKYIDTTQFLIITHRKGSMEAANTVYGVTMEENGVSKLLSLKLT